MTIKETIEALWFYKEKLYNGIFKDKIAAFDVAIEACEKQMPKRPKHIHEEHKKHEWKKDRHGNIDLWAFEYEYHNGPQCERCGESYCEHCDPHYDSKPCVVDKYVCPTCGKSVYSFKKKSFCEYCGQAIDWSDTE